MRIKDLCQPPIIVLEPKQNIKDVLQLMAKAGITQAPIIEEGKLIGFFELSASVVFSVLSQILEYPTKTLPCIENYMIKLQYCVGKVIEESQPLDQFLEKLNINKDTPLYVVDSNRNFSGMITDKEIAAYVQGRYESNHKQFTAILHTAYNCIVSIDITGKITFINKAYERIFGGSCEEVLGQPVSEVFPGTNFTEVIHTGQSTVGAKYQLNGVSVISNRAPIVENGQVVGAVAVLQDITELESISKELTNYKNLSRELNAIIDSSYDGVYVCDGQGITVRVNKAIERLTGYGPDFWLGKHMKQLEDEGILNESVTLKIFKDPKPMSLIQEINTGKKTMITGNPIFDEDGNIFRVVTNVRDISELNYLREELARTKELYSKYHNQFNELRLQQMKSEKIVAKSREMITVLESVCRIAQVDATVLITGETGVGKEVIAKMIHNFGVRAQKGPLIKINCGAIPKDLLESELFGYEPGSFTGAGRKAKPGLFELADKGTLFLDEIGDLDSRLQVKLLRVLQEREFMRIGGTHSICVDVRIVAATNRDLEAIVGTGEFRKDLYYRLNVIPLNIPALRDRKDDIAPLLQHFLQEFNAKYNFKRSFSPQAFKKLSVYSWPGNVRQLSNLVERLVVMTPEDIIDIHVLPEEILAEPKGVGLQEGLIPLKDAVEDVEKHLIIMALEHYGNTYEAAKALGISQPTMSRKAAKYLKEAKSTRPLKEIQEG